MSDPKLVREEGLDKFYTSKKCVTTVIMFYNFGHLQTA